MHLRLIILGITALLTAPAALALPAFAGEDTGLAQHGAIALNSSTRAYGYAFNAGSRRIAQQRAVRQCGAGCTPVLAFRNGCGALALGSSDYGAASADTRPTAQRKALLQCRHEDCVVVAWACTDRPLR